MHNKVKEEMRQQMNESLKRFNKSPSKPGDARLTLAHLENLKLSPG